jgi:hypothetical protein
MRIQVLRVSDLDLNTSGLTVTIDYIEGLKEKESGELGHPRRRDPDHLPPSNLFEAICYQLRALLRKFYGGNTLFAIKAGTFSSIIDFLALIVSNLVTMQFSLLSHRSSGNHLHMRIVGSICTEERRLIWPSQGPRRSGHCSYSSYRLIQHLSNIYHPA